MPGLQTSGYQLIVAVDELETYFASEDAGLSWHSDLSFFGNLHQSPCAGILSGSSGCLEDLLRGEEHLQATHPKARHNYNLTKIRKHRLPVTDPFGLSVSRRALLHQLARPAREIPESLAAALLMIGGGSKPGRLFQILQDFDRAT